MTGSGTKSEQAGHRVVVAWTSAEGQALAARCVRVLRPLGARLMSLGDQGGVLSPVAEAAGWLGGFEAEARIRASGMEISTDDEPRADRPVAMVALDPTAGHMLSRARARGGGDGPLIGLADIRGATAAWRVVDHLGVLAEPHTTAEGTSLVGPLVSEDVERAAGVDRQALLQRFALQGVKSLVLASAGGLSESELSSLLFQLGLLEQGTQVLIDVGSDASVAGLLRERARQFEVEAQIFGDCEERAALWAAADAVVGVPNDATVRRVLYLRKPFAAIALREDDRRIARALEALGLGRRGELSAVSAAVEVLLRGRRGVAEAYEHIPRDAGTRLKDLVERCLSTPPSAVEARVDSPASPGIAGAGPLERIGHVEARGALQDEAERAGLAEEQVTEHGEQVQRWQRRLELATRRGDQALMQEAERRLEAHRARMHAALDELARLQNDPGATREAAEERFREMEVEQELARLKAQIDKKGR